MHSVGLNAFSLRSLKFKIQSQGLEQQQQQQQQQQQRFYSILPG